MYLYKTSFNNSSIKVNSGKCEDSLNIVNSKGTIKNVEIVDAFSDGVDLDFSDIKFISMSILNSGNDCLDVSGGVYEVLKIIAKYCGDKGISVGEKSKMKIDLFEVSNSSIGLSSKDLSITSIKNFKQRI